MHVPLSVYCPLAAHATDGRLSPHHTSVEPRDTQFGEIVDRPVLRGCTYRGDVHARRSGAMAHVKITRFWYTMVSARVPLDGTHRSPLHYLFHLFPETAPQHTEYITPMRYDPATIEPAFTTHIASSREESHREDAEMDSVIRIYSDGSGYKDQAGAAAVLVRTDGVHEHRRVLRYHLGPLTEHTVYEAETVGIILGAHLLLTEDPEHASRDSSISLDNQAVIRAVEHMERAKPGHYLLDIFHDLADRLIQTRDERYSLTVRWISGHDNAELNEFVDGQAKLAAEGRSSVKADLPTQLHTPLRASISATRQEYDRQLNERWKRDWRSSIRYRRHKHWAPDAASKRHMALTDGLSRRDSAVLFQLRSGHAPLNAHLHRIKCADTAMCEACEEADETVAHFIYDCPARQADRNTLRKAAGKRWRNRGYLMGNEKGVRALLEYVRKTGRMRWGRKEEDEGRPEERRGEVEEEEENGGGGARFDGEGEVGRGGNGGTGGDEEDEEDGDGGDDEEGEATVEGLLRWIERLPRRQEAGGDETQRERDAAI